MALKSRVNISFSSNDGYAEHLQVAIYSLLRNLPRSTFATIYILDGGISLKNKQILKNIAKKASNASIFFITIDRKKYDTWNVKGLSQEAYYRLDLPDLLPDTNKILYLDVDLIVNGNIFGLYNTNISRNTIGAVREITTINYYLDDHRIVSPHEFFFNSGVLLLNLQKMREENIKNKILECMRKHNFNLKTHDQEALNIVLLKDRFSLSPKYNALPFLRATKKGKYLGYTEEEFLEAKNKPVIIHFAGEKPWKQNCFHPLAHLYHKYRKDAGLKPITFDGKLKAKEFFKQKLSQATLFLQANLPNNIYRYLIYKPYRFIFRIK